MVNFRSDQINMQVIFVNNKHRRKPIVILIPRSRRWVCLSQIVIIEKNRSTIEVFRFEISFP